MKQANNNEVDLLLRSLAKRGGESPLQRGPAAEVRSASFSAHLDADELNSYAEGLVPVPAHTRYTEHLADCSECRRIVIGLTQASGRATRYESPDQESGLGFWQRLAAAFSPAVLRYAVPALILAGVIGVGLLALRQQRLPDFIAENRPVESSPASVEPEQTRAPAETSSAVTKVEPQASPRINKEKNDSEDKKSLVAQAPVASDSNPTIAPLEKDAAKAGQATGGVAELKPSYAPEPRPPAPPASVTRSEAERAAGAQAQLAKREGAERSNDAYRNQPVDEHGPNRAAAPRSSSATGAGRRDDGLMRARGPSGKDKNAKTSEAESSITTVAGRRFTREGNTWVDTAYESPRATINVRRGSEQFRALVADEAGLRTIADQLSGVVYVVWKSRAYRIQ